ncbi:MAG TPA: hypothetical protein DDY91_02125 [Planctomycetaceae bacterium]|nr:hypothetical protein [Planctomycetaceae bacterium]
MTDRFVIDEHGNCHVIMGIVRLGNEKRQQLSTVFDLILDLELTVNRLLVEGLANNLEIETSS